MSQDRYKLAFPDINIHTVYCSLCFLNIAVFIIFQVIECKFYCFDDSHLFNPFRLLLSVPDRSENPSVPISLLFPALSPQNTE